MISMLAAVFESGRLSIKTGLRRGRGPNSTLLEVRVLLEIDEAVMVLVRDVVYGFGRLRVGDDGMSARRWNSSALYCEGGFVSTLLDLVGSSERYLRSPWERDNRI